MCTRTQDHQGTSYLCTRCSHWVHSRCSGLLNVADDHRANGWICTACRTPPQPRAPSPPPSPAHTTTISDKTFNILQGNQTDGTKHLPQGTQRQSGGHLGVQAHGKIEKSQHPELHPSTIGSTPRSRRRLNVFSSITQAASLASHCQQRRRMTPTLKN